MPATDHNQRDVIYYYASTLASGVASSIIQFAIPLLIFNKTRSLVSLGLATAVQNLSYLAFGLIIGHIVDSVNRRRVMIVAEMIRIFTVLSLSMLWLSGELEDWLIYLFYFLITCVGVFFDSADFAAVPNLVDEDKVVETNARLVSIRASASIVGPAIGTFLVNWWPPAIAILLNSALYLSSLWALYSISTKSFRSNPSDDKFSLSGSLDGIRYLWRHPHLRWCGYLLILMNFFGSNVRAQIVAYAKSIHALADTGAGEFYIAAAVGTVVLSFLAKRLKENARYVSMMLWALFVSGLCTALMPSTSVLPLNLVFWAISVGASNLFNVYLFSWWQTFVPKTLLGRVYTAATVVAWAGIPGGALAGAYFAESTNNLALLFVLVGVARVGLAVIFAFIPPRTLSAFQPKGEEGGPT